MTPTVDGIAAFGTLALVTVCLIFAKIQQRDEPASAQHALTLAIGLLLAVMAAFATAIVEAGV